VIRVEDLVKRYKKAETNAVDGISFQVKPGEFFVLLGPNGAGKTTTISILTTTLSPTSGGATIDVGSQRAAQQIFPFVFLPQYFLAGLFNPIWHLPLPLDILSKISPMRYAVDLTRDAYYSTTAERVQLFDAATNLAVIGAMFVVFMVVGTFLFVRAERNR
jgi:ABC-type uncharacterized transport system ATPase subunit